MDIQHWACPSLVHHHLLIRPLIDTQNMLSSSLYKTGLLRSRSAFTIASKVSVYAEVSLKTNKWCYNRITNWWNWQELFNNEHQIPDRLFSDCLTHRERKVKRTHTDTHNIKHAHTQKSEVNKVSWRKCSALLSRGNQIKLAECHIRLQCCCWQAAAGWCCVLLTQWQAFLGNRSVCTSVEWCYP